jgi:phage/plasmid-like protein (TIGR03299 family)
MSHDIASLMGRSMMAYQAEMPWHALGTKMEGSPDVPAALEAAHLNWNVALEDLFLKDGTKINRRKAVVRDVDHKVLHTVGDKYHPLQNAEAFGVLQPACEKFGVTIETAGALGVGDKVWMLAKLPDRVQAVSGDYIDGYFLVMTGHNGKTRYTARPTPVRAVCANTIAMALESKEIIELRHIAGVSNQMKMVTGLVTTLVQALKKSGETFGQLAAKRMSQEDVENYIAEVLGIEDIENLEDENPVLNRRFQKILELSAHGMGAEFAPGTLWSAFNGITEYIDHVRPAEAHNTKSIRAANKSAIFGKNAKLKAKALVIAAKLAA